MTVGILLPAVYTIYSLRGIVMNKSFNHIPVLLNECIDNLNIKPDGIYIDGTIGGART